MSIEAVLREKFGDSGVDLMVQDNKLKSTKNRWSTEEKQFRKARNEQLEIYIQKGYLSRETILKAESRLSEENKQYGWGFDFPGWLGEVNSPKDIMIIGQEPLIVTPYFQIAYNLYATSKEAPIEAGKRLYERGKTKTLEDKIDEYNLWYRIPELFARTDEEKPSILTRTYITSLCSFAPFKTGSKESITKLLRKSWNEPWVDVRARVMEAYMMKEINAINPKYIIFQCDLSFSEILDCFKGGSIEYDKNKNKVETNYRKWGIYHAKWGDTNIFKFPHIGSIQKMEDGFWKSELENVRNFVVKHCPELA